MQEIFKKYTMKNLFLCLIAIICIYSCKPAVKKLGANPKVSYYIVGRLKTTEVTTGIPFEIKVLGLDPQLIEKPISFKIESLEKFSLSYSLNNKMERKECTFGEEIKNENMDLLISRSNSLDITNYELLKNIDYRFQVKGEEQ